MTLRRSYIWLMVVLVLLVSAWLGARGLNADAIWLDEYFDMRDMRLELYAHKNTGSCVERMAAIVE